MRSFPRSAQKIRPLISLLVHKGDGFDGAVDAWMYRSPEAGTDQFYVDRQLLERGVVAALFRRGVLDAAHRKSALAYLDSASRPKVYANLVLPTPPRPYTTFQPKMPALARHLYVADVQLLSHDEKLMLISLEGIVNRKEPRIYLVFDKDDRAWLDELAEARRRPTPRCLS